MVAIAQLSYDCSGDDAIHPLKILIGSFSFEEELIFC